VGASEIGAGRVSRRFSAMPAHDGKLIIAVPGLRNVHLGQESAQLSLSPGACAGHCDPNQTCPGAPSA